MTTRPGRRPPKRIFQPVRGRLIDKLFWKTLRVPRAIVHPVLSAAKIAANPPQYRLRRRVAEEVSFASQSIGTIRPSRGYLLFGPDALPGIGSVTERCTSIFHASRAELADQFVFNRNKRFLLSILKGSEFCEHPDLIRFMLSRPILDTATQYLGSVPLLAGAALWWSPDNQTSHSSQLYHLDNEDRTQAKVLINMFDTTGDHGPFTFLPADVSERIRASVRYVRGRIDDERVKAGGGEGRALELIGPAGSGAFIDTARCLHFGSRRNRKDRLVLMIHFLRFHSPSESTFRFQRPPDPSEIDPDPVQKLALGIR